MAHNSLAFLIFMRPTLRRHHPRLMPNQILINCYCYYYYCYYYYYHHHRHYHYYHHYHKNNMEYYPCQSEEYYRWWFVNTLLRHSMAQAMPLIADTSVANFLLRALGALGQLRVEYMSCICICVSMCLYIYFFFIIYHSVHKC